MSSSSERARERVPGLPILRRVRRRIGNALRSLSVSLTPMPPAGFDWQSYLDNNEDLAAAGIEDERSAIRHWRRHGRREGRSFAPGPEPDRIGPPPGFDWKWYVRAYTDLAPAGITDEASAIRHWRTRGRREGRRFAPRRPSGFDWLTYVDQFPETAPAPGAAGARRRLVCPSVDSLFLRAWGDLVCWDDAGSDRVLQTWDPAADFARVFLEGPYERVRESNREGRMAWPEECGKCLLLRILPPAEGACWDRRSIQIFRVEPSYYCTLDCSGCVPLAVRRRHRDAFQLDPMVLDRILADLSAGGLDVQVLDFQGHGEPLLNPRVWEMARRSRERLPYAWITMTTNAQARFRKEMACSGFDEIVCSIDGIDEDSYRRYRVHGRFDLAWRFLLDFVRASAAEERRIRVVWKYILFQHNSSRQMLLEAQRMALDTGVSELVFIVTRNGPAARDIRSPSDIPRLEPGPRISFRFHEPSIEDLEARLNQARDLGAAGHADSSSAMADSVRRNLDRFYPSTTGLPDRHRKLLEQLGGSAVRLPVHPSARPGA
jgi:hypothetical protein